MDYNKISNSAIPAATQQTASFTNEDVIREGQATQASNADENQYIPKPDFVSGSVCNCKRLNIRKKPKKESEVLMIVDAGEFLQIIEPEKATGDWYKVVAEIDEVETTGFCMKEFVTLDE